MLKDFVEKKHYLFADKVENWQEAIKLCCKPIEEDGTVDTTYADQLIECINKYGPYIVLIPGVAMPHSMENAKGVTKTTISFMKLNEPVSFDDADPDKYAKLFFTLASCDHDAHLENIGKLSEMLLNEDLLEDLMKAQNPEDLLYLHKKYL